MTIKPALTYDDVATGLIDRPCKDDFAEAVRQLGGPEVWKATAYTPSQMIARGVKLSSVLWAFTQMLAKHDPFDAARFAVVCAEAALPVFERDHPHDDRPRKAIEAAKRCVTDPSDENRTAAAAAAAAEAAVRAAAAAAALAAEAAAAWAVRAAAAALAAAEVGTDVIALLEAFIAERMNHDIR